MGQVVFPYVGPQLVDIAPQSVDLGELPLGDAVNEHVHLAPVLREGGGRLHARYDLVAVSFLQEQAAGYAVVVRERDEGHPGLHRLLVNGEGVGVGLADAPSLHEPVRRGRGAAGVDVQVDAQRFLGVGERFQCRPPLCLAV